MSGIASDWDRKPKTKTNSRTSDRIGDRCDKCRVPPPPRQVSLNPAYQLKEAEFTLRKVCRFSRLMFCILELEMKRFTWRLPFVPQVQCKALVCPSSFKTQKFCEMLRELCPEMGTSPPGAIRSARCPMEMFSSKSRRR